MTDGKPLDIRVLGGLEVRRNGTPVAVTAPLQRVVLAALALSSGRPVSVSRLVEALWDGREPRSARVTVHNYVRRLRAALDATDGPSVIGTGPDGYLLDTGTAGLDAVRFQDLLRRARAAREDGPDVAASLYRAALREWRGDPLAGLACSGWLQTEATRLTDLRLVAVEEWAEVVLAVGRAVEVAQAVEALQDVVRDWPLRESARAVLLTALHKGGRTAEALAQFRAARRQLRDELGIEPGAALRRAHADVLGETAPPEPMRRAVPAQLPGAPPGFVAREEELALLDAVLAERDGPGDAAAGAVAVSGPAGVGKSTLALHWAHRVAPSFPDGQLYVNLRGFDPQQEPMTVGEAVRGFLAALDVPEHRVPVDVQAQVGLYRSLLAGSRTLVVLDNAGSTGQAAALLPGAPGCLTVVTSRHDLGGLVTTGARPVRLGLLDDAASRALLLRRLGPARLEAEPAAVASLVTRCGGLPLALAIAAARLLMEPGLTAEVLADDLDGGPSGLEALSTGDPGADIAVVFSWSVRALDEDAVRLFRLLGLHPGPHVTPGAAASLDGVPVRAADAALARLARANLVQRSGAGQYVVHDLVRAYATGLVTTAVAPSDRVDAARRLADHYLQTAVAALRRVHGERAHAYAGPAVPGITVTPFRDADEARAWLDGERPAVIATAVSAAATAGQEGHSWRLARALTGYLFDAMRNEEALRLLGTALAAAERTDDTEGRAYVHHGLAQVLAWSRRYEAGLPHLDRAAELFTALGDLNGQGRCMILRGYYHDHQGGYAAAIGCAEAGIELLKAAGETVGVAACLNNLGWARSQSGDHEGGLAACLEALEILRAHGASGLLSATLDSVGFALLHTGRAQAALPYLAEAVAVAQQLGQPVLEAEALSHIGDGHRALGDQAAARGHWLRALTIMEDLGLPDADAVRARFGLLPAQAVASAGG